MKTIIHLSILILIALSLTFYTTRPVNESQATNMAIPLEKHVNSAVEKLVNAFPIKFNQNENMEDTSLYNQTLKYWQTILNEF
jgi:predicted membrane-bound mannosyltransferase